MNTLDLSTLTVSPCVTRFHYLSHSLMAFLTVLQILSGFFSQTHNFLRKQTRQQNIVALPSTYKKKNKQKKSGIFNSETSTRSSTGNDVP